mmetsp:Transcript_40303/g.121392  ORF Transcript_40303/g.121392 Transcript_40303/m.121392 type:complete len:224 (-) Transcript_40303:614-1285(-)
MPPSPSSSSSHLPTETFPSRSALLFPQSILATEMASVGFHSLDFFLLLLPPITTSTFPLLRPRSRTTILFFAIAEEEATVPCFFPLRSGVLATRRPWVSSASFPPFLPSLPFICGVSGTVLCTICSFFLGLAQTPFAEGGGDFPSSLSPSTTFSLSEDEAADAEVVEADEDEEEEDDEDDDDKLSSEPLESPSSCTVWRRATFPVGPRAAVVDALRGVGEASL